MHRWISTHKSNKITFKKTLFFATTFGVISCVCYWNLHIKENVQKYQKVYNMIPKLISKRKWHHSIPAGRVFTEEEEKENEENLSQICKFDTVPHNEPVSLIDATDNHKKIAPFVRSFYSSEVETQEKKDKEEEKKDSKKLVSVLKQLDQPLDSNQWNQFLKIKKENDNNNNSNDDVETAKMMNNADNDDGDDDATYHVSFGIRKAFTKNSVIHNLGFTHAVVLVQSASPSSSVSSKEQSLEKLTSKQNEKQKHRYAIFGYNARKVDGLYFRNDTENESTTKLYTFYNELTLKGNQQQVTQLFQEMERLSNFQYRVFSCNCFSSIILAMQNYKKYSLTAPEYFVESLLTTIPIEQNFGFGVSSNPTLKKYVDRASANVNYLMRAENVVERIIS